MLGRQSTGKQQPNLGLLCGPVFKKCLFSSPPATSIKIHSSLDGIHNSKPLFFNGLEICRKANECKGKGPLPKIFIVLSLRKLWVASAIVN